MKTFILFLGFDIYFYLHLAHFSKQAGDEAVSTRFYSFAVRCHNYP